MKRKLFHLLPLMAATLLFMVSCSSKSEGTFIPKNASFVCHIDVASLWEKGDLANADNLQMVQALHSFLQGVSPEGNKIAEALLKDPASCGIDFRQPLCFFSETAIEDIPGIDYFVANAKMQNRNQFDNFLADLEKATGEKLKHCDTLGMTALDIDRGMMLAYNGDIIFFIYNTPEMLLNGMEDCEGEVLTSKQYLAKLLNLKKDESMAGNKNFANYLTDRKDISYFMNYGHLMTGTANPVYNIMKQFYGDKEDGKQLENASMCFHGSFENGRIEFTSKTYGIPETLHKIGTQKFNGELLSYLPAQTLAAFTFSVDMNALADFLGSMEEMNLDEPLGIDDYTVRDLINALGGSMAISFYGFQEGLPYFAVAIDLNDSQVARDLLNELAVNNGNVYSFDFFPMQLVLNDKVAVLTTDPAVIANAQAGGKSNGLMTIADKAKKGNYFYMDLNLEDWPTELLALIGFDNNPIATAIFAMFNRIEGETINDNRDGVCNIYLSNDKENSLAYILHEVDKMI